MAEQQALIDWPLTPYTGWGGYGIQLAQALLSSASIGRACWLVTIAVLCDLHWLDALQHLEDHSRPLGATAGCC